MNKLIILGIIVAIIIGVVSISATNFVPSDSDFESDVETGTDTTKTNNLKVTLSESLEITTP